MLSKCFLYVKCETPQSGNTTLPLTDSQGRAGDPVETGPPVPPAPPLPRAPQRPGPWPGSGRQSERASLLEQCALQQVMWAAIMQISV